MHLAMKRTILIVLLGASLATQAQLSPYYSFGSLYYDAEDLFDKKIYGPALQRLDLYMELEEGIRNAAYNDLHTQARFMQAVSAYHLERADAVALLEEFGFRYPENSLAPSAQYYLGKYYLDKRNYRDAIDPLEKAYRSGNLPQDQFDEVVFFLGYAYFQENKSAQATRYFDIASRRPNPWQEDAAYYKAIILYKEKDYASAYEAFGQLRNSRKYSKETRIYLANTMLKLKKYQELYVLADELIQSRPTGEDAQVFYIVANASFEREDYLRTTEYFERFTAARGRLNPSDNFRFGYAYYKQQRYKDAIPPFEQAVGSQDSLAQVASYYLGFSFLEVNDEASAKFAFKKASDSKSNLTITQDALYQYGKVAFATKSYNEALTAFQTLRKDFPNSPFTDEVDGLIGEVFLYTRDYPRSIRYLESVPRTSARAKKAYQTVCYYYALGLYERGGFQQAEPFFQKTIDNSVDASMALSAQYWLAESKYRQGQYGPAKAAYQSYLGTRGANTHEYFANASYGLGWVGFMEKNYAAGLKGFETYIAQAGRNADKDTYLDAHLRAADCLFLMRDYGKANRYYQQVIDFRYTSQDYANYQMAEALYRQGSYQPSVQSFERMISTYRNSDLRDDALDRISEIYFTWIKNLPQASRYSKMLVDEYPRSPLAPDAYIRLGLAAYNNGDEAAAITYFKKVVQDYPQDRAKAQVALDNLSSLLPEREFDKIFKDFRKNAPQMDEGMAQLSFKTGQDRFFANNYQSAIDQFSTYINEFKNGPNYFEALVFRARSYRELGQMPAALKDYEVVYSTPSSNAFTSVALQEAAEIRYERKEYMASLQLFQTLDQVAGSLQNKVAAKFGVAKNYNAMGDYAAAINILRQIAQNPEVAAYSRTKANVEIGNNQYLSGDKATAKRTFQDVEREFKNDFGAESQYMIGKILLDEGTSLKAEATRLSQQGSTAQANEKSAQAKAKFEEVKQAVIYQSNNYPTVNYWKAKAFLVAADAFYELGNTFQAKGTLESLISEDRFPDVQEAARKRLQEIQDAENARLNMINP